MVLQREDRVLLTITTWDLMPCTEFSHSLPIRPLPPLSACLAYHCGLHRLSAYCASITKHAGFYTHPAGRVAGVSYNVYYSCLYKVALESFEKLALQRYLM
jgi:hypothetical protein